MRSISPGTSPKSAIVSRAGSRAGVEQPRARRVSSDKLRHLPHDAALTLPQTVNIEQVQATDDAGILRIELAKRARQAQADQGLGQRRLAADACTRKRFAVERTASA